MKLSGIVLVLVFQFTLAMASASPSPSVIVIGAGVSGILAAKTLHDAGVQDFLILEADNRIGGRLHRTLFAGHTVELGANWIPGGGPKSSPFYEIASQIKLKSYLSDYDNISSNTYKQEGGLYPKQMVAAALETAEKREDFCTNLSILLFSNRGNVGDDISILASQRLSGKIWLQGAHNSSGKVIDYYYMDYEDAEPPRNTGLKNTLPRHEFIDFGEDQYFVSDRRGFESMVNQVAQQFLSKKDHVIIDPRLKLNKVVREINYSVSGVQVKAEDGSVYQTKYAIVSVSVGVLQSNLIQFHPQLPLWKTLALNYFDMAIYTKIFLKFPYKFWPSGPGTEFFLYAHEIRGYYPICQHLENEMPGSNILFVTVTDDESRRVEQLKDDALQAEAVVVLRKMFGNKIPNPEAILVPRWWSNRFFKGSFSNWPAGYTWRRYQQLRAPVGPIYFTGEYANATYLAYAEAAYFAGIRTADNVIKRLKTAKRKGHGISD